MFFVSAIVKLFATWRVKLLSRPATDLAIEFDVRRVQFRLPGLQSDIESLNQSRDLVAIEVAVVIVQIVQVRGVLVLGLVISSLDTPHVGPVRRRRVVGAKQIVRT